MRTHSAPGFDAVYEGVVDVFFALPDESWVYPGHGHDTTIGAERPHLEEWRLRRWRILLGTKAQKGRHGKDCDDHDK